MDLKSNAEASPGDTDLIPPKIQRSLTRSKLSLPESCYIDYGDLVLNDKIHDGNVSVIYEGEYQGQEAAIKIYNPALVDVEEFKAEFKRLSSIRSPHVVYFYGLCLEPKVCVVMELCKSTLEECMRSSTRNFTWELFFKLGNALLSAVKMLHSQKPPIVHGRIRPNKLLIVGYWQLKLGDFGVSKYNAKGRRLTNSGDKGDINALAYCAPEFLNEGSESEKIDIYSTAIVLWQLATRVITGQYCTPSGAPTPGDPNAKQNSSILSFPLNLKVDHLHPLLSELLRCSWHLDPHQRLSARDMLARFKILERDFENNPDAWHVDALPARIVSSGELSLKNTDSNIDDAIEETESQVHRWELDQPGSDMSTEEMEAIRSQVESKVAQELHKPSMSSVLQQIQLRRRTLQVGLNHGAEIQAKDIQLVKLLGRGAFGEVWKGIVHGTEVAVKKLFVKDMSDERDIIQNFLREVNTMTKLRHGNICQLMGVCTQRDNLMLVMEFCSNGDVHTLLNSKEQLSFMQRMQIGRDVALAMNWLHCMDPPILHLDLKPANFLLDKNMTVKVADFGLARIKGGKVDPCWGTQFYMSPEAQRGDPVITEKADVYSFGVCMWQLLTRQPPYKYTWREDIGDIFEHIDLEVPDWCPSQTLRGLIEQCWNPDPSQRPSFSKILANHTFQRILLEAEITDPATRVFWAKYFLVETAPKPKWPVFWSCLGINFKLMVRGSDDAIIMLRSTLANKQDFVTASELQKFVHYFGPFEPGMITRLHELASQPWFHGDITLKQAESLLSSSSNFNGAWLVRYAARAGDFRISVIPYNMMRRVTFKHFIVVNYEGTFVWLQPSKRPRLQQSAELERDALLKSGQLKRYQSIKDLIKDNYKAMELKNNRYIDAHKTSFATNGTTWWALPKTSTSTD